MKSTAYSESSVVFETWYTAWLKRQFPGVHVSPDSAETLVRRGGITNHHLIAYFLGNISANNYQKSVDVRWSYSVQYQCRFWDTSVYMQNSIVALNNPVERIVEYGSICFACRLLVYGIYRCTQPWSWVQYAKVKRFQRKNAVALMGCILYYPLRFFESRIYHIWITTGVVVQCTWLKFWIVTSYTVSWKKEAVDFRYISGIWKDTFTIFGKQIPQTV